MKISLKLTAVFFVLTLISTQTRAQQNSDLIGTYEFHFDFGGAEVKLERSGTYRYSSGGCTDTSHTYGTYAVDNEVINFKAIRQTVQRVGDTKEHSVMSRKDRKKYLDDDSVFEPHQWSLNIVRWGQRVYLVESELLGRFVDSINLGFEPRTVGGYRVYYASFFLRSGDESKTVEGLPTLPAELLRDILTEPVVATITDVKEEGNLFIAVIDHGRAEGLKNDMAMVSYESPEWADWYNDAFRIASLDEHSARVSVSKNLKVGDKITTRIAHPERY